MEDIGAWLNTREFNAALVLKQTADIVGAPIEYFDVIVKTSDGLINRGMPKIGERGIEWYYLNDDGDWIACTPPLAFLIIPGLIFSNALNEQANQCLTSTLQ